MGRRELDAVAGKTQGGLDEPRPGQAPVLARAAPRARRERRAPRRRRSRRRSGRARPRRARRAPAAPRRGARRRGPGTATKQSRLRARPDGGVEVDRVAAAEQARSSRSRPRTRRAQAATAASAAEPPSPRISSPASTVAGCPAAIAARIDCILTAVNVASQMKRRNPRRCGPTRGGVPGCDRRESKRTRQPRVGFVIYSGTVPTSAPSTGRCSPGSSAPKEARYPGPRRLCRPDPGPRPALDAPRPPEVRPDYHRPSATRVVYGVARKFPRVRFFLDRHRSKARRTAQERSRAASIEPKRLAIWRGTWPR